MYLFTLCLLLLLCNTEISAEQKLTANFEQFASSYCSIDNYSSWLEQKASLSLFLQLARFLALDTKKIEREMEIHRLQDQCLKQYDKFVLNTTKE